MLQPLILTYIAAFILLFRLKFLSSSQKLIMLLSSIFTICFPSILLFLHCISSSDCSLLLLVSLSLFLSFFLYFFQLSSFLLYILCPYTFPCFLLILMPAFLISSIWAAMACQTHRYLYYTIY